MDSLKREDINTWFDLGLFLDRLKDKPSQAGIEGSYEDFKHGLAQQGGVGFVTFYYAIDGITIELEKYTSAIKKILPGAPIYFIGGEVKSEAWNYHDSSICTCIFPEIQSFDNWDLYEDFFKTKLERGSEAYNRLIIKFWDEVLTLTEKLGQCMDEHDLQLLFVVNVNSNPGNVALALAVVLVSEYLGIPVINNCHDYYWEGGNSPAAIKYKKVEPGPRDFFFTNAHVGEFFSTLEVLLPWESRSWMTVNINHIQYQHVIEENGHNPANVAELGTAVDFKRFEAVSKRESIVALSQVGEIIQNKVRAVKDVIRHHQQEPQQPYLCGNKAIDKLNFAHNNIMLFQPTRVIKRKSIEWNFRLVEKMFKQRNLRKKFKNNPQLTLSIIISGPIPAGQRSYYYFLLQEFAKTLKNLPKSYRDRVFLGFLFSEFDKKEFKSRHKHPLTIHDLYRSASLILLPSETEGRGLPIIEAAASGKPIFSQRYHPQEVYAQVIGEDLEESLRLRVLEFDYQKIPGSLVEKIVDKIFYPQDSQEDLIHNEKAIKKRFKMSSLRKNLEEIFYALYIQLSSIPFRDDHIADYFERYQGYFNRQSPYLASLLNQETRHYLPGFGRMGFMIFLKSLIDPSFFRVEEQQMKGMVHLYAKRLHQANPDRRKISTETYHRLCNIIDDIFHYHQGEVPIRHDHSIAYRHRNKKKYPYRSFTYHELTGLVNLIYQDIIAPPERPVKELSTHVFFSDWNLALVQLTNSHYLGIDNREKLFEKLKQKIPRVYFPGRYVKYEMEFFVLQPIRAILNLGLEEELTEETIKSNIKQLPQVYIFIHENHVLKRFSTAYLNNYLKFTQDRELKLLFKHGIAKIVKTNQLCIGFHLMQMGDEALKVLNQVKEGHGFIITNGQNSAVMTDILDIDHFHIGQVKGILTSRIMGIPRGSGFVQFVPAGVRTTLAYPTPIQTAKDFDNAVQSKQYKKLIRKIGEEQLQDLIRVDAMENGTPILEFLQNLEASLKQKQPSDGVQYRYVGGVYSDGLPWSGVLAHIDTQKAQKPWNFMAFSANTKPKSVPEMVSEFKKERGHEPRVAWNGGYILNPELVGKLGLPETYIGTPLGLLIMDGQVVSTPLFNKPAFIIYQDGTTDIQRVNSAGGLRISRGEHQLLFDGKHYNHYQPQASCYYDLLHEHSQISAADHYIVRLAGNVVKEVIDPETVEAVPLIPVGLTLSIPRTLFNPELFKIESQVNIELMGEGISKINWSEVAYAVEAGPGLVTEGKVNIQMDAEGWKTQHSINTQAARLDFTDMRGPKIAVGLTKKGEIMILMVNGRIRESVGATHQDMADIMISYQATKAMGFDPGGSSTLVVDGKLLNISPYNSNYEKDIFSLPPEPRFVSNAIIGWQ